MSYLWLAVLLCFLTAGIPLTKTQSLNFRRPGTTLNPVQYNRLKNSLQSSSLIVKVAAKSIVIEAASLTYPPLARRRVYIGYNPSAKDLAAMTAQQRATFEANRAAILAIQSSPDTANHDMWSGDADRVYKLAVAYIVSGKKEYASKAIEIVMAWSVNCTEFGVINENGPLEAGWGTTSLLRGVLLLRYNPDSGWTPENERLLKRFVNNLMLPQLRYHDIMTSSGAFKLSTMDNWGSTILDALMMVSILNDDVPLFNDVFRKALIWIDTTISPNGRLKETTRDTVHAQYNLGGILNMAEIAYHQGRPDLYTRNRHVIFRSMEYHAGILLGETPPDLAGVDLSFWNGFIPACWDLGINHYQDRMGFAMPKSKILMDKHRPEGYDKEWGLTTLTHYGTAELEQAPVYEQVDARFEAWYQLQLGYRPSRS